MKKQITSLLLGIGLMGLTSLGGCLAVHAEEKCACIKDREKFANMVAEKVIQKQQNKGFRNP